MFAISIDTDWAIQPLIDEIVDIFSNFNIKGTFFVTNQIDFTNLEKMIMN